MVRQTLVDLARDLRSFLCSKGIWVPRITRFSGIWEQVWLTAAQVDKQLERVYCRGVQIKQDAAPMAELLDTEDGYFEWTIPSVWTVVPMPRITDLLEAYVQANAGLLE